MHGFLLNTKRLKRMAVCVLSAALLISLPVYAGAKSKKTDTQQKLEDTQNQINSLNEQMQDAQSQIDSLNAQKSEMEEKLGGLNQQLSDISTSLEQIETDIANKNQEIEDTKAALIEAGQRADRQYQDMKLRIQFMYENGDDTFMQLLFESDSFSDFLNKADYVEEITAYDRQMLDSYRQTQADIAAQETQLEAEQAELVALEQQMSDKQGELSTVIADTQTSISQYAANISDQQSVADDLQRQIEEQQAYEQQLEIQKAREDAARLAEIKRQEEELAAAKAAAANSGTASALVSVAAGDQALLAALIYCEAGGESYEGQLAVGSVVMNRVRSQAYPNSVSGVIYQGGQFSPVASGRLATVLGSGLTSASCSQAAQEVLNGNITNGYLHFRQNNGVIEGSVIGNHVFY